jgi:hypothetical protein
MHTCSRSHGIRMRRMGAHVACGVSPRLASWLRMQLHGVPERSASALVQVDGGAVFVQKGELVFDGVAISDTSATVRCLGTRSPVGPPATCHGGPAQDRRRVQVQGGAVYMADGAVTFNSSSTITRTRAVRPARRTQARAHALVVLVCGSSTGTGTSA